ncbi:MAG: hypothetical protein GY769_07460 [bacterium]|nr:hypothetical protein [bacterium]
MALIELNLYPARRDLRWFGLIVLLCFLTIGGLVYWRTESLRLPVGLWAAGALLSGIYYAVEPLRVPIYRAWMLLVFPIGWTVSHLVLALIYYLLFTPIGLLMRLFGRDPMHRRWNSKTPTYWIDRQETSNLERYFRQF